MDKDSRIAFLEGRIEALEREKNAALHGLELAATLGSFEPGPGSLPDRDAILERLITRASGLLSLEAASVYLAVEETGDFMPALCIPPAAAGRIGRETERLIADHCFSGALAGGGTRFYRDEGGGRIVLRAVATPARLRGVFVGLLPDRTRVSDVDLALFDIVLLAGAHALESWELYRQVRIVNKDLEERIDRRTAELSGANAYLRSILDSVQTGVMLVDAASHEILDINPAAARMIGLPKGALVGRNCTSIICPAQGGSCPARATEGGLVNVEHVLPTASGLGLPVLRTTVPVTVHDRDCFLESFVDLSERKKLEMLREDVERIARHDLKTPLTAVIGFSSILLDTAPLAGEEREMLDMIRTAGQRMLRMINRSLDLFKMETGQYVPELQEVDLAAAVSAAVTELSGLARRRSVSVDVAWPGGAAADSLDECRVVAMGEEGLCATILENLLKNALEAAPPGSRVRIGLGLGDGRAWVSINNPGEVRPEVARRFFEKYATAGKRGGTGLGTYSARLMATTMGGTIELATSAADGTTLLLRLPAA